MLNNEALRSAQDPISGDYQQVLHWTIQGKQAGLILLQLLAIPVVFLVGVVFLTLAVKIGKIPANLTFGFPEIGIGLAGIFCTILLHELVHGLTMQWFGARPQYGILWKPLMFYATSPGYGFRRNSYLLVALMPLVGLSCLAVLGMFLFQGTAWVGLLSLCAIFNASGAIGDGWLVSIVLRYPPSAYIVDERDGLRVFLKKDWSKASSTKASW